MLLVTTMHAVGSSKLGTVSWTSSIATRAHSISNSRAHGELLLCVTYILCFILWLTPSVCWPSLYRFWLIKKNKRTNGATVLALQRASTRQYQARISGVKALQKPGLCKASAKLTPGRDETDCTCIVTALPAVGIGVSPACCRSMYKYVTSCSPASKTDVPEQSRFQPEEGAVCSPWSSPCLAVVSGRLSGYIWRLGKELHMRHDMSCSLWAVFELQIGHMQSIYLFWVNNDRLTNSPEVRHRNRQIHCSGYLLGPTRQEPSSMNSQTNTMQSFINSLVQAHHSESLVNVACVPFTCNCSGNLLPITHAILRFCMDASFQHFWHFHSSFINFRVVGPTMTIWPIVWTET